MKKLEFNSVNIEHIGEIISLMDRSRKDWSNFKPHSAAELTHDLTDPQEIIEEISQDGKIIGLSWISHKKDADRIFMVWPYLIDESNELIEEIIAHTKAKAIQFNKSIETSLPESKFKERDLLLKNGYSHVRTFNVMFLSSDNLKSLKIPDLKADQEIKFIDATTFHEIFNESFADHYAFSPEKLETIKHWYAEPDFTELNWQGLFLNNKPIGYFVLELKNGKGIIDLLGVLPEFRGRGFGRLLLQHASYQLRERGAREIWLSVDTENTTQALKLYESSGFILKHRFFRYKKDFK